MSRKRSTTLVLIGGAAAVVASLFTVIIRRIGITVLRIGDTRIDMLTRRWKGSSVVYLNLHENEVTSVDAAESVLSSVGGVLIKLQHGGARFLDFEVGGRPYVVDPNRIFTDAGADLSVAPHDEGHPAAVLAARRFAVSLLAHLRLPPRGPLVALHNNSIGEPLTIMSYAPGGLLVDDADGLPHIEPDESPDDFFLVTTRALFDAFVALRFNVVLQNNATVLDDGSLSVYCGQRGIVYVNVEAAHGALDQQERMIRAVAAVLRNPS